MPRASRWLVRLSLLQLGLGALLGALLLAAKAGLLSSGLFALREAHAEMLAVGWLVQFTVGVGGWVLPPVRSLSIRERPLWAAALLLNAGVVLVAVAAAGPSPIGADGLRLAGRSLEAAGIAAFAWPLLRRPFR